VTDPALKQPGIQETTRVARFTQPFDTLLAALAKRP